MNCSSSYVGNAENTDVYKALEIYIIVHAYTLIWHNKHGMWLTASNISLLVPVRIKLISACQKSLVRYHSCVT
jgi:hypothetical protein